MLFRSIDPDTSETYRLELECREFDMGPVDEARKALIKEARDRLKPHKPEKPPPAEGEDPSLEAEEEEEEPEEEIVVSTGAVRCIFCNVDGSFLMTVDDDVGAGPGAVWRCEWDGATPTPTTRHGGTVVDFTLAKSEKYYVSTAADGSVCVVPSEGDGPYWQGRPHGASRTLSARLSFDDAFIVSAGEDGTLFVTKVAGAAARDSMLNASALPTREEEGKEAACAVLDGKGRPTAGTGVGHCGIRFDVGRSPRITRPISRELQGGETLLVEAHTSPHPWTDAAGHQHLALVRGGESKVGCVNADPESGERIHKDPRLNQRVAKNQPVTLGCRLDAQGKFASGFWN